MNDIYAAYGQAKEIQGAVLEIGLGWGFIADALVIKPEISNLISYEKNTQRVNDYTIKNVNKHTVREQDILLDTITDNFDVAIIDVFDGRASEFYDLGKDIVTKILPNINSSGKIIIEYQIDTLIEKDFRAWMENQFGLMKKEFIHTGLRQTSRSIAYYNIS